MIGTQTLLKKMSINLKSFGMIWKSENTIHRKEKTDMYKAIYTYQSNDANALCFVDGDKFTLIDSKKDTHWWLVQNGTGQVGFVPANYLAKDEGTLSDVVKSIDRAIAAIHTEACQKQGGYTNVQRANLQKLQKHRENVMEEQQQERALEVNLHQHHSRSQAAVKQQKQSSNRRSTRAAPPPPPLQSRECFRIDPSKENTMLHTQENVTSENYSENCNIKGALQDVAVKKSCQPPYSGAEGSSVPTESDYKAAFNTGTQSSNIPFGHRVCIPNEIGTELVEKIRISTGLSHKACIGTIHSVVSHIKCRVPELDSYMEKILETLHDESVNSKVDLTTDDAKRLGHIFTELATRKDDSQQRSWFLHEDEHIISKLLEDLLSILNGANSDICKTIIARDHYAAVDNLVLFYQMEIRLNLRMLLLQVFGSLCGLSPRIISELLNSVLTCELARDIQTDTQEMQKFCYSSLVLTMIFCQGESVPLQYYTQLNDNFIHYLLECIENPPENDIDEQVPDLLLNLVLAFNLHYELPQENAVMKVLAERGTAKVLTEKLLLLVNRGDDPVRMFEHQPKPPNAVLKFLSDLYSTSSTSNLLYTNDVKVLIDIVLRQLTDLSPGEILRTEYLSIVELLLKNHNYAEHHHRHQELETCFKSIYNEEDPSSDMDKRIIVQIWRDLPDLFESDCLPL